MAQNSGGIIKLKDAPLKNRPPDFELLALNGGTKMTDSEYIKATNRVKISIALTVLRDVLACDSDEYGITPNELVKITRPLRELEEKLFSLVEIKEG